MHFFTLSNWTRESPRIKALAIKADSMIFLSESDFSMTGNFPSGSLRPVSAEIAVRKLSWSCPSLAPRAFKRWIFKIRKVALKYAKIISFYLNLIKNLDLMVFLVHDQHHLFIDLLHLIVHLGRHRIQFLFQLGNLIITHLNIWIIFNFEKFSR